MPLAIAPPIFRAENERDSMPDQTVGHTLNIEMARQSPFRSLRLRLQQSGKGLEPSMKRALFRLIGFFSLTFVSFSDAQTLAHQDAAHPRLRNAVGSAVLTVEEEKMKAAMPGSEFKECASGCPVMIVVPTGKFNMGSPENEADRQTNEGPQHEVTITEPLAVSRFEVTFEEWDVCVAAAACADAPEVWGRGHMPVINVSWIDAKNYVAWLVRLTGKPYRLLSEAEWEYCARGGTKTRYSWGDEPGAGNANCNGCGTQWDLKQTAPVGSFEPNTFGLYDMHGNVWEWVEDRWHEDYVDAATNGSAWLQGGQPIFRVIRGGSWRNESELLRAAVRERRNINVRFDTLGFRVARTMRP
jgi:formylglycine-generating enzyme required for sulfatase activity